MMVSHRRSLVPTCRPTMTPPARVFSGGHVCSAHRHVRSSNPNSAFPGITVLSQYGHSTICPQGVLQYEELLRSGISARICVFFPSPPYGGGLTRVCTPTVISERCVEGLYSGVCVSEAELCTVKAWLCAWDSLNDVSVSILLIASIRKFIQIAVCLFEYVAWPVLRDCIYSLLIISPLEISMLIREFCVCLK